MDLHALMGCAFPEPYDAYYTNFKRLCACWMKSIPKFNKAPSELEDYFKILMRTITHPTIEPRFKLNSYLKYSFFLDSPMRPHTTIRTSAANPPGDPLRQHMKDRMAAEALASRPVTAATARSSASDIQSHLTDSSNLMRCINSSQYVLEHLEIVTLYLSKFSSRIRKFRVAHDLKVEDPLSGLAQMAGFCAELNSITSEAILGTACLATTAAIGFAIIVDFFKDPNALLSLFANAASRFRIPTEDDNQYARIKISVCMDMIVRSYEKLGKPGYQGGWSLRTGQNKDLATFEEFEIVLMGMMNSILVLHPMCANLLEVFRVLVHSDSIEKSYLLKVIRSFSRMDQIKLCGTIQQLCERVKKIHRVLSAITGTTDRIVRKLLPSARPCTATPLPFTQPSCLDFFNEYPKAMKYTKKKGEMARKHRPRPDSGRVSKEKDRSRVQVSRETLKSAKEQNKYMKKQYINVDLPTTETESMTCLHNRRPRSSRRPLRLRTYISKERNDKTPPGSPASLPSRPASRRNSAESIDSLLSTVSKQFELERKTKRTKDPFYQMSGDRDGFEVDSVTLNQLETDGDVGLQTVFKNQTPVGYCSDFVQDKDVCNSILEKLTVLDAMNNNAEDENQDDLKFEPIHGEPPGSEAFDNILDKISELKKEVSSAKTFEIRREGVFKLYEVKKSESGRQLYELQSTIDHPADLKRPNYPPIPYYKHLNYAQKFEDDDGDTYEDGEIDRVASKLNVEGTPSEIMEVHMTPYERAMALEAKEIANYKKIFGGSRTYFDLMEVWEKTKKPVAESEKSDKVAGFSSKRRARVPGQVTGIHHKAHHDSN